MHFTIYLYNAILRHLEYIHVVLKLDCLVNIVQSKIYLVKNSQKHKKKIPHRDQN